MPCMNAMHARSHLKLLSYPSGQRSAAPIIHVCQGGVHTLRQHACARAMHVCNSGVHMPRRCPNAKVAHKRQGGTRTPQWRAYAKRMEWKSGFYSCNNNNCKQMPLFLFPIQVSKLFLFSRCIDSMVSYSIVCIHVYFRLLKLNYRSLLCRK